MPQQDDDKAFVVKDRRRFDASGNRREADASETSESEATERRSEASARGPQPGPAAPHGKAPSPPSPQPEDSPDEASPEDQGVEGEGGIEFSEFILSLATNAIVHLGGDSGDGRIPGRVNLPLAAQHIDILGMLAQKTRGNLTRDEVELVQSLLYDLRMKYVSVAQSQSRGR